MELSITDLSYAIQTAPHWPTKIISLLDAGMDVAQWGWPLHKNHLVILCHDIDREIAGYTCPAICHLDEVIAFAKTFTTDDKILIHCHAGISRSTSMAMLALIAAGMTWQDAFKVVENVRPIMHPNRLIIELIDQKFGFNSEFYNFVAEWKKQATLQLIPSHVPDQSSVDSMQKLLDLIKEK